MKGGAISLMGELIRMILFGDSRSLSTASLLSSKSAAEPASIVAKCCKNSNMTIYFE